MESSESLSRFSHTQLLPGAPTVALPYLCPKCFLSGSHRAQETKALCVSAPAQCELYHKMHSAFFFLMNKKAILALLLEEQCGVPKPEPEQCL